MFQLLPLVSNLSVFCLLLCARTRLEVELYLILLACPRYGKRLLHMNSSLKHDNCTWSERCSEITASTSLRRGIVAASGLKMFKIYTGSF